MVQSRPTKSLEIARLDAGIEQDSGVQAESSEHRPRPRPSPYNHPGHGTLSGHRLLGLTESCVNYVVLSEPNFRVPSGSTDNGG